MFYISCVSFICWVTLKGYFHSFPPPPAFPNYSLVIHTLSGARLHSQHTSERQSKKWKVCMTAHKAKIVSAASGRVSHFEISLSFAAKRTWCGFGAISSLIGFTTLCNGNRAHLSPKNGFESSQHHPVPYESILGWSEDPTWQMGSRK